MSNKHKIAVVGVVIIALLVTGCLETEETEPDPEVEDRELIAGTTDMAASLDPAHAYDNFAAQILYNTADRLVDYEPGTEELKEGLAEDWEIQEGGEVYNFQLRQDATFHNGEPVTAEDVKFSLERARDLQGNPSGLVADIDEVEVVDDHEFNIHLEGPSVVFKSKLGYTVASIVPEGEYPYPDEDPEELDADEKFTDDIVASGPYELAEYESGERIVLEENEDYWGEQPGAETVEIKIYDDSEQLREAKEQGEIDVAYRTMTPSDQQQLIDNEEVQTKQFDSPEIRYIVMDSAEGPFDDKETRQALAEMIDRGDIVEDVYSDTRVELYSMIPNEMWGHKPVFNLNYGEEQDIEDAEELLEEAGYSEEEPLEFTLWYTPSHYGDLETDMASELVDQFSESDLIEAEVESETWEEGVFIERMVTEFDIHLLGWYPDFYDPDNYLHPFLHSEESDFTGSFYADDEMDQMLEEQREIIDHEERTEKIRDIQDKLGEDVPYIPLVQGEQFAAFSQEVEEESVVLGPVQIFRYYTIQKEDW